MILRQPFASSFTYTHIVSKFHDLHVTFIVYGQVVVCDLMKVSQLFFCSSFFFTTTPPFAFVFRFLNCVLSDLITHTHRHRSDFNRNTLQLKKLVESTIDFDCRTTNTLNGRANSFWHFFACCSQWCALANDCRESGETQLIAFDPIQMRENAAQHTWDLAIPLVYFFFLARRFEIRAIAAIFALPFQSKWPFRTLIEQMNWAISTASVCIWIEGRVCIQYAFSSIQSDHLAIYKATIPSVSSASDRNRWDEMQLQRAIVSCSICNYNLDWVLLEPFRRRPNDFDKTNRNDFYRRTKWWIVIDLNYKVFFLMRSGGYFESV